MQKLTTFLLSASTVLFAQSASASWSVGGFIGQSSGSSLIECQGGDFPITTLTSTVFDPDVFNAAIESSVESVDISPNGLFLPFVSLDSSVALDLLASGVGITTTETVLFGSPADNGLVFPDTPIAEFVVGGPGQFSPDIGTPVFVNDGVLLGNDFNASDLGEFLSGTSGEGTTLDGIFQASQADGLEPFQFLSAGPTVTQSFGTFECNNDTTDVSFSINFAYNFSKIWGIEAGYVDLGEFSSTFSASGVEVVGFPLEESFDASAVYLAATGSYYYNDKWSVTGRVGIYHLDVDRSIELGGQEFTVSEDDEDFYYGLSWNYDLSNLIQFQLRYDNFDVDVFSLGIRYKLGK